MQEEYPYLKPLAGSESEVICTLCAGKFSVADGGRARINAHIKTQKHIKALDIATGSQPITAFFGEGSFKSIDTADTTTIRLKEHLAKCRCCFRSLVEDQKHAQITDYIEQNFFEVTQIEVS